MRKISEKIALVAQICITLVFVITTVLYMTNTLPQQPDWRENGVMSVLMIVLAAIYAGLSAYMLYSNFADSAHLKQILLFCDSDSATHTNIGVINNIVKGCARQVEGIKVTKTKIRSDEKGGLVAVFSVRVSAENVSAAVNTLRCLLTDSFLSTLGISFNTINFAVEKLRGRYSPSNLRQAQQQAETLQEKQEECSQNYQQPLEETQEVPAPLEEKEDG